jgi:hypothetical protein
MSANDLCDINSLQLRARLMHDSEIQTTSKSLCLIYTMKNIRLSLFKIQKRLDISLHFYAISLLKHIFNKQILPLAN